MANNLPVSGVPSEPDFTTDVMVVGTGPAGVSLASFLGSYGKTLLGENGVGQAEKRTI